MKATAFCCRCRGHEKRSALIARYYCEGRWGNRGACCHARARNHWEQNEEKWRQRFTFPWGIRCLRIVCTYYNHRKHEPFAIYYQRLKEKEGEKPGGWGFGSLVVGLETDRIRPAASHDSILIPFSSLLLSLWLCIAHFNFRTLLFLD